MAIKRALVVDDSRSARAALKALLEERGLDVALAESGEAALDFLKKESADVIFMDHTMPGMDGLEAVSAIKANPATATIPVMMYTTREGEVYVGQARALGAVGVLPKNVQPHQLFEMLLTLGLVQERRVDERVAREVEASTAQGVRAAPYISTDLGSEDDPDRVLEDQALGISVQNLVSRILEDQHLTLRSDILRSQKGFARDVAREILREQAFSADAEEESAEPQTTAGSDGVRRIWVAALAVGLGVACFLAWQFKEERDAAIAELVESEVGRATVVQERTSDLGGALAQVQAERDELRESAVAAVAWGLGTDTQRGMYDPAFDHTMAAKVTGALERLEALGFTGTLRLSSHLGRFCLRVNDTGTYELAAPNTEVQNCEYVGHVLENSSYVSERISPAFAPVLQETTEGPVRLEIVALDAAMSETHVSYPTLDADAAAWNTSAEANNRVVVELLPSAQYQVTQTPAR